jgi:hypothetical protein
MSGQGRPGHPGQRLLRPRHRGPAAGGQIDAGIAEIDGEARCLVGRGAEPLNATELIAESALADH